VSSSSSRYAQTCDICHRPVTLLFLSAVCDWCERSDLDGLDKGFVVWRGTRSQESSYVFPTYEDAARWSKANGLDANPIFEVRSEEPFVWKASTGTLDELTLADRLYEIYPNRRFPKAANRAFLAPGAFGAAA